MPRPLLLLMLCLFSVVSWGQDSLMPKDTLVLFPLQTSAGLEEKAEIFGAALQEGLSRRYDVFYGPAVEAQLQKEYSKLDCSAESCAQNVALAFNGELIGDAEVSLLEGNYVVRLQVRNIITGRIDESRTEYCRACDTLGMLDFLKRFGAALANPVVSGPAVSGPAFVSSGTAFQGSAGIQSVTPVVSGGGGSSGGAAILVLDSQPSGADVYIGGIKAGRTPYQNLGLAANQVLEITLRKDEFREKSLSLTLKPGTNTVRDVTLQPAFGSLKVFSEPSGAQVTLAGEVLGTTPLVKERIPSGNYLLNLTLDQHDPLYNQRITIQDGAVTEQRYQLQSNVGTVILQPQPDTARLTVTNGDGSTVVKGHSAEQPLDIAEGSYQAVLEAPGYEARRYNLTIVRGHELVLAGEQASLRRLMGSLVIAGDPFVPGARVLVGGEDRGEAPLSLDLPVGTYQVEVRGGELSGQQEIHVEDRARKTVTVALSKRRAALEPEMITVLGGSFEMGDESGSGDEKPAHRVRLKPFQMAAHEVTRGQFAAFISDTGYRTDAERNLEWDGCYTSVSGTDWDWNTGTSWRNPGFEQGDDHPVVCVSMNDIRAYITWLNRTTGKSYRLPSESEWEFAAKAGRENPNYYWGDDESKLCRNGNVADHRVQERFSSWNVADCNDGHVYTAPVGQYPANPRGLFDMIGNVREWVSDCYFASYEDAPSDGSPWLRRRGDCRTHVIRGGSWTNQPRNQRLANRMDKVPERRDSDYGFRLAHDL